MSGVAEGMKTEGLTLLVAGGAGFIGSNFVRYILGAHADWRGVNVDKLTYPGNLANLADVAGEPRSPVPRVGHMRCGRAAPRPRVAANVRVHNEQRAEHESEADCGQHGDARPK